jgi:hypothetical protein
MARNALKTEDRRRLERRRQRLAGRLAAVGEFVRGSVVLMKRRCSRPGCRTCRAGGHHPTWVLTVSRHGKTRTVYLGSGRMAEARRLTGHYRRLLGLVEEIADVNLALLLGPPRSAKGGRDEPDRR